MTNLDPMNDRDFSLISAAVKVEYLQKHIELLGEHLRSYSHYDMVLLTWVEIWGHELNEILGQYLPEDLDNGIELSGQTSRGDKGVRDDWHDR